MPIIDRNKMNKIIIRNTIYTDLCDHVEVKYSYSECKSILDIYSNQRKKGNQIKINMHAINTTNNN